MRWIIVVLFVLAGVPGWSGLDRLPLLPADTVVHARGWRPAGGWPARIGALEPLGAVSLWADRAAFGGFSALSLAHGRALLLSDDGNFVAFRMRGRGLTTLTSGALPGGPGTGWLKEDRDSESLVEDARTGALWVGFENANEIWRYAADFRRVTAQAAPAGMRDWPPNGGAEALTRLHDGRFVAIDEVGEGRSRAGLLFAGDPTRPRTRPAQFRYVPPRGYDPSDAAVLPSGDLLVLNRRFDLPFRFTTKLVRVPHAELRPGATVHGREIATLGPPHVTENGEGVAITREHGATIVWIVTDNDGWRWRPTLLMKFRLAEDAKQPAVR